MPYASFLTITAATRIIGLLLLTLFSNAYADKRGLTLVGDLPTSSALSELASSEEFQSTYRALIIGNNNYQDPKRMWKPLQRAVSDAQTIEALLSKHYGFTDIVRLENATRRDMLHALHDLSQRVQTQDNVLVYYAGHGFLDESTNKGFWVPVDAEGTDHTTFVRNSTIRDEISTIAQRAKHTLLISDSCFSGTLLKSGNRGLSISEKTRDYFKSVNNKKSVQIITAGGAEYVDDDFQSSGHSPFTYFLKNELENNPNPILTATELGENVRLAVSNNVEQEPQKGVLQGAGDELGEFLFIKVNIQVSGVPKDKIRVDVNIEETTDESNTIRVNSEQSTAKQEEKEQKEKQKTETDVVLPIQAF